MTGEPEEPALFDLPLAPPVAGAPAGGDAEDSGVRRSRHRAAREPRPESLPLFPDSELEPREERRERVAATSYAAIPRVAPETDEEEAEPGPRRAARPTAVPAPNPAAGEAAEGAEPGTAPLAPRFKAALGDLILLAAVGAIAAAGARALGGALSPRELPALLVFVLAFSFLYCVVSLAFWGQTPGMAWSGLVARTDETEPLSFGQTALRWLGQWLTWALLGLPALLAATSAGRSLADRLSGSATYELAPRA